MPFDWTKPQYGVKGQARGLASVVLTEDGWRWIVRFGKMRATGWCATEQEARNAADARVDLMIDRKKFFDRIDPILKRVLEQPPEQTACEPASR